MNAQPSAPQGPGTQGDRIRNVLRVTGGTVVVAVVLVAITPNPPVTLADWIQVIVGASLTASVTTIAGKRELRNLRKCHICPQ